MRRPRKTPMNSPRLVMLAAGLLASAATSSADTIVSYLDNPFASGNITNSNDSLDYSAAAPNVTASVLTKSITNDSDAAYSTGTGTFFAKVSVVPSSGNTAWLTFNVSVHEGYTLDLASLAFKFGGSNSGASSAAYTANCSLYYSLNNFATAGTLVGSTANSAITLAANNVINLGYSADMDLSSIAGLAGGEAIAFRIFFTDDSGSGNLSFRLDDIALTGTVAASAIPEPSVCAIVAGALVLGLATARRRVRRGLP